MQGGDRGSGSAKPTVGEDKLQEVQEYYEEAFERHLITKQILPHSTSHSPDMQSFSMNFPLFGPIRNRGGATYFDDRPHVEQLASRHAEAFQRGPLYGEVNGYRGEVLFDESGDLEVQSDPIHENNLEELAEEVVDRYRSDARWRHEPIGFIGPPKVISELEWPGRNSPHAVRDLKEIISDVEFVNFSNYLGNRLYVLPRSPNVGTLEIHPAWGTVEFGDPMWDIDRFWIKAEAYNKLVDVDRSNIMAFQLADSP